MKCKYCGIEFEPTNTNQTKCKNKCPASLAEKARKQKERRAKEKKNREKSCDVCKVDITHLVGQTKVCSPECKRIKTLNNYKKAEKKTLNCVYCGGVFKSCRIDSRFCNRACANRHYSKQRRVEKIEKECKNCSRTFEGRESQKACSPRCVTVSQSGKYKVEWRACKICNIDFPTKLNSSSVTCSGKCSKIYRKTVVKPRIIKPKKVDVPIFKSEPMPKITPKDSLANVIGRRNEKRISLDDKAKNLQEEWLKNNKAKQLDNDYNQFKPYEGKEEQINNLTEVGALTSSKFASNEDVTSRDVGY